MRAFAVLTSLLFASCASSPERGDEETYFHRAYRADPVNRELQTLDQYLDWVESFYRGAMVSPGWTKSQADLCEPLDPLQARIAEPLLEGLGRLMGSEWAKDNKVRRFGSEALQVWASVLRQARDEGRILEAIDAIFLDVRSLLSGTLDKREILKDRYAHVTT